MNSTPLVSIITVSYNSDKTIADTIESVVKQTYKNIEYIIIDGKSSDNTLDIIEKYKNDSSGVIFKVVSESDQGLYDAMNKGISMATGDIIGIINSDDLYIDSQVITDVVDMFNSENTDAVYSDLVFVDEVNINKITRTWISKNGNFNLGWMPPHPTLFLKSDLYKKYGSFNIRYRIAADYDLMYRILNVNNCKKSYLPRVTIKMRMGGESTKNINSNVKANKEVEEVLKSYGAKFPKLIIFMKIFRKIPQLLKK